VWGGAFTLAEALQTAQRTLTPELATLIAKLRVNHVKHKSIQFANAPEAQLLQQLYHAS
jgi:hypothetical protein